MNNIRNIERSDHDKENAQEMHRIRNETRRDQGRFRGGTKRFMKLTVGSGEMKENLRNVNGNL
jgi:hypothetical protein